MFSAPENGPARSKLCPVPPVPCVRSDSLPTPGCRSSRQAATGAASSGSELVALPRLEDDDLSALSHLRLELLRVLTDLLERVVVHRDHDTRLNQLDGARRVIGPHRVVVTD